MSGAAGWWDNPSQIEDTPVIRHAPDDGQYHVPDDHQTRLAGGSPTRRWATIPRAKRNGASTGFDPNVAGPVHVDPLAPDGGVIFDPNSVDPNELEAIVDESDYPHQAFYKLGVSASALGIGRNGRITDTYQEIESVPRSNSQMPAGTYITPAAEVARPQRPTRQEEQRMAKNLGNPPRLVSMPAPIPTAVPPPATVQQEFVPPAPVGQVAALPQQAGFVQGYPMPYPYPPPQPTIDAATMMSMFTAAMDRMQQNNERLLAAVNPEAASTFRHDVPTTGMSRNPLPKGPPAKLRTLPAELTQQRKAKIVPLAEDVDDNEDFADETARPIHTRTKRDEDDENAEIETPPKKLRRLPRVDLEAEEADDVRNRSLVRQQETKQTVGQLKKAQSREPESIIAGFETLNIPFITGPIGNKPKKKVLFDIAGAGQFSAVVHDVVVNSSCMVLVYDTRFEEGTQYVPPRLDDVKVHVSIPATGATYSVGSLGITYSLGVLDFVVLIEPEQLGAMD